MSQVSSTKKLLSASALMASGTLISRILGMVRVILIAFILGNGTRQADMLGIATMVPNAIYILFAGGALNTVLVPQIVRAIKNDEDGGEAYTNRIMTAFMLIVGLVAVVATIAAPFVTWVYSSPLWRAPALADQYASMVALTYLTLPQIFFYGVFFLLSQVLNARDKFGPMMWAPIANNVVSILVLSLYFVVWGNDGDTSAAFTTPQILVLGIGATLGIVTQALILLPFLKRVGFKLRPRFDLKGTGLGHTFSLTKWTLGFVAVNQLALIVVNRIATIATASGAGAGVQVYSNAHLLWILPHSLITTSLATAMLPNASRLAASNDFRGVAQEMTKTVRLALVFIVPSAVVFLILGVPISTLLFGHGSGADDAMWVGWALMAFAVGLVPFTVQFVCLRTFYALEDTRTPFLLQIGIAGVNAGAALLFIQFIDDTSLIATALAASYSLAYFGGVFVSWQVLRRRLPGLSGREVVMHIVRLLLGAVPAGIMAWFLTDWIADALPGLLGQFLALAAGGLLILGGTLGVGKLLKVRELNSISSLLRRRRGAPAPEPTPAVEDTDEPLDETRVDGTPVVEDEAEESLVEQVRREFTLPAAEESTEFYDEHDDGPPTTVRPRPAVPGSFDPDALLVGGQASSAVDEHSISDDDTGTIAVEEPPVELFADPIAPDSESTDPINAEESFEMPTIDEDANTEELPGHEPIGEAGLVLGARYQLFNRLAGRIGSETWHAHDQVLSRDVVAHIMPPDAPRAEMLLNAARRGAAATDSRFLRVLDVDRSPHGRVGVYAICEYSPGEPLSALVRGGLGVEAGSFIVREVADALSTMHAQGLFHEHLDLDHILITPSGGVRIVGFGVTPALVGRSSERPWSEREGADVVALAKVLRATQSGQQSESLDAIVGEPLSDVWRWVAEGRVRTMSDLAGALPAEDSTEELEAKELLADRVRRPNIAEDVPAVAEENKDVPAADLEYVNGRTPQRPRYFLWLLVILAFVALIVGLITVAIRGGGLAKDASGAASSAPAIPGVKAKDFDPKADGGNDSENPEKVKNTVDGKSETTWTTVRYLKRPNMGGLKPGVGVMLDLGTAYNIASVEVEFKGAGPTTVALYSSSDGSMRSIKDWKVIAPAVDAPAGTITITPAEAANTRYVLVYVSKLPPVEGGYQAEIAEIRVNKK